jgi:hypothetical protein
VSIIIVHERAIEIRKFDLELYRLGTVPKGGEERNAVDRHFLESDNFSRERGTGTH